MHFHFYAVLYYCSVLGIETTRQHNSDLQHKSLYHALSAAAVWWSVDPAEGKRQDLPPTTFLGCRCWTLTSPSDDRLWKLSRAEPCSLGANVRGCSLGREFNSCGITRWSSCKSSCVKIRVFHPLFGNNAAYFSHGDCLDGWEGFLCQACGWKRGQRWDYRVLFPLFLPAV